MAVAHTRPARRRRRPEEAEREILDAAEDLLRADRFSALTVDELMSRTGLSRASFYVYFRDRHHLIMRLTERIGGELFEMSERWLLGSGDPLEDARSAVEGVAAVYVEHGPVLRAIADAASHDPEVERIYHGLVERFVDATARRIREDIQSGRIEPVDPEETAKALVWMNERYLTEKLGRLPQQPVERVVQTLWSIWVRALYGRLPADPETDPAAN
jgi:TetR/AcrR family transcriptional regulator, ethionamide resistance regulator